MTLRSIVSAWQGKWLHCYFAVGQDVGRGLAVKPAAMACQSLLLPSAGHLEAAINAFLELDEQCCRLLFALIDMLCIVQVLLGGHTAQATASGNKQTSLGEWESRCPTLLVSTHNDLSVIAQPNAFIDIICHLYNKMLVER